MPIPKPRETEEEFMSRCVPLVLEDGGAESAEQAVAICSSLYDRKDKGQKYEFEGVIFGKGVQNGSENQN